jgi:hypothetical protein
MLNLHRISRAGRARRAAAAGLGVFALVVAPACDPYTTLKDVPLDCEAEAGYGFGLINDFEKTDVAWWTAGDDTPYKKVESSIRAIPDGGRCGSKNAAVLATSGNNDWGSLFGLNVLTPRDASAYEGVSFWARAPGNSTKGFMILLNDPNTATMDAVASNCIDLGNSQGAAPTTVYVEGQAVSTSGAATRPVLPNECGNGYTATMLVTSEWAFYTVPFGRFQQDPKPNRVPNELLTQVGNVPGTGLLTQELLQLILRMPKEARTELWLDNLAYYRRAAM